jgi:hypothetical protein
LATSHCFNPVFMGYHSTSGCNPTFDFGLVVHDAPHLPSGVIDIRVSPDLPFMERVHPLVDWGKTIVDGPASFRRYQLSRSGIIRRYHRLAKHHRLGDQKAEALAPM